MENLESFPFSAYDTGANEAHNLFSEATDVTERVDSIRNQEEYTTPVENTKDFSEPST